MPTFTNDPRRAAETRRRLLGLAGAWAALAAWPSKGRAQEARSSDLAAAELKRAAERASLCSASNVAGVGLQGEYFADTAKRGPPLLTRIDGPVDFNGSLDWPDNLRGRAPHAVRWSGWVKPMVTGRYRFHADAPGTSIKVSQRLVEGPGAAPDEAVDMAAGRFYPISLEWSGASDPSGGIRLEWTTPYGARFVVPRTLLYLPSESVLKK